MATIIASLSQNYTTPGYNGLVGSNKHNVIRPAFQFWASPVYQTEDGRYWSPGFDGETFATNPWDFIKLGVTYGPNTGSTPADRTPGICRVHVGKGYDVDMKKPQGGNGMRATFTGTRPAGHKHSKGHASTGGRMPFDVEFEIWTPEQLRQFNIMWAYLVPQGGKGAAPIGFDASHPVFTTHGIAAMQFISGEGFSIGRDRRGIFKAKAIEFFPPPKNAKSAVSTPPASMSSTYDPVVPSAPGSKPSDLNPSQWP